MNYIKSLKKYNSLAVYFLQLNKNKFNIAYFVCSFMIMGLLEVIAIFSIIPFLMVILNTEFIYDNYYLNLIYSSLDISEGSFITFMGVSSFLLFTSSNLFIAFTSWRIFYFTRVLEYEIATRLYKKYLTKNFSFFLNNNTSKLEKNILSETSRITTDLFWPLFTGLSKIPVIFFIIAILFYSNPQLSIYVTLTLILSYLIIFILIKKILTRISFNISNLITARFNLITESFEGIRLLKLSKNENIFLDKFSEFSKKYASEFSLSLAIGSLPKYFLEIIAFFGILLLLFYFNNYTDNSDEFISLLALFAIAGLRLLPSFQSIYFAFSKFKFGFPAALNIKNDLENYQFENNHQNESAKICKSFQSDDLLFKIQNLSFSYDKNNIILNKINLKVEINKLTVLLGKSGSGKSTLLDNILGLLNHDNGEIFINEKYFDKKNCFFQENFFSYVPQDIFIFDDTLANNIACTFNNENIDYKKLESAIQNSDLSEFVNNLKDGYEALLGQRGSKISGGQKQRIGIARALYNDTKFLIMDESLSQLDFVTEKNILDTLTKLKNKLSILIISHRLSILSIADNYIYIENGEIIDQEKAIYFEKNKKKYNYLK